MVNYTVRVGTTSRPAPAGSYNELLTQPVEARPDDGRVIVWAGDLEPRCADCGVGTLQWAEAGYVPWHRICDRCGSHWELHPIIWGPAVPTEQDLQDIRDHWYRVHEQECAVCAAVPLDPEELVEVDEEYTAAYNRYREHRSQVRPQQPRWVRWEDGVGVVPLDPDEPVADVEGAPTWGEFVARITPEMLEAARARADRMAGMVVVPCAWARRARFYA